MLGRRTYLRSESFESLELVDAARTWLFARALAGWEIARPPLPLLRWMGTCLVFLIGILTASAAEVPKITASVSERNCMPKERRDRAGVGTKEGRGKGGGEKGERRRRARRRTEDASARLERSDAALQSAAFAFQTAAPVGTISCAIPEPAGILSQPSSTPCADRRAQRPPSQRSAGMRKEVVSPFSASSRIFGHESPPRRVRLTRRQHEEPPFQSVEALRRFPGLSVLAFNVRVHWIAFKYRHLIKRPTVSVTALTCNFCFRKRENITPDSCPGQGSLMGPGAPPCTSRINTPGTRLLMFSVLFPNSDHQPCLPPRLAMLFYA